MARRKHTRKFKVSAVKLVNEQGYSRLRACTTIAKIQVLSRVKNRSGCASVLNTLL